MGSLAPFFLLLLPCCYLLLLLPTDLVAAGAVSVCSGDFHAIVEHEGHRPSSDNDLRDEFLDLFGVELCDYSKVAFADDFSSLFVDLCIQFFNLCFDATLLCAEGTFGDQSLHEQFCEVAFFLAEFCHHALQCCGIVSLRAFSYELIVCGDELLSQCAVLQSGAVAFSHTLA